MKTVLSEKIYNTAETIFPGGVNSPVRAFTNAVPRIIESANGCRLKDVDGNEYYDFVSSFGPHILGHNNSKIIEAAIVQLQKGTSYGAPVEAATQLGSLIKKAFSSIEKLRFVNSGTEAVMTAIRLARGFTKRNLIVKFDGHYHGHSDSMLVAAGSAMAGQASSAGVTQGTIQDTLSIAYNDLDALDQLFKNRGSEIAAVIVEPVAGNMGLVKPIDGFLEKLSHLTRLHRSLLIFDEVITGFRLCFGGAQKLYSIIPDLTCLGKIIGAGFPIGAVGGRAEILDYLAPLGPVYQAGTLSGNPLALAAGIAQLESLTDPSVYFDLSKKTELLISQLLGIDGISVSSLGSMFTVFFSSKLPQNLDQVRACDSNAYKRFHALALDSGLYLPPAQMETAFVSAAFDSSDIEVCAKLLKKNVLQVLREV